MLFGSCAFLVWHCSSSYLLFRGAVCACAVRLRVCVGACACQCVVSRVFEKFWLRRLTAFAFVFSKKFVFAQHLVFAQHSFFPLRLAKGIGPRVLKSLAPCFRSRSCLHNFSYCVLCACLVGDVVGDQFARRSVGPWCGVKFAFVVGSFFLCCRREKEGFS